MLKRDAGARAERRVERFLRAQGLKLVARNWSCRLGELDLVMRDGEELVFVEVRARAPRGFGSGIDSVDRTKQRKLVRAAELFIAGHRIWIDAPCRFDVVGLDREDGTLSWICDAFQVEN